MRKTFISLMMALLVYHGVEAAAFKDAVDLADLAQLSPEALETLKDAEFKVLLGKIELASTQEMEQKTRQVIKSAKLERDSKKFRLKAAQAEIKDAKAASDRVKIDAAEKTLNIAKNELEVAKTLVKWKDRKVDAAEAGVERAKAALSVREAERELIWASKLKEQKVPAAAHYIIPELKKKLENKQKDFEAAVRKEKKKTLEANKLKTEYEKLFK